MIPNYYRNTRSNNMYYTYTPNYHKQFNNVPDNYISHNDIPEIKSEPIVDNIEDEKKVENKNNEFRIGPASISKEGISIFGLDLHIDDIIIIVVIIFLFFENKKDYLLLIILALMLFDISFDSIKNMKIFNNLFDPG